MTIFANVDPDPCNACTLHVSGLANGFSANGWAVTLMAPRCAPDSELRKLLGPRASLSMYPRPSIPGYRTVWSLGTLLGLPRFVAHLVRHRPALIYVRSDHATWLLHAVARIFGVVTIAEHNSLISLDRDTRRGGRLRSALYDIGQRLDCAMARHVRAVTEGVKSELVARGAAPAKIFVLGNGTDLVEAVPLERETALSRVDFPVERTYAGFLGHLVWWQGCDQLLEAFIAARDEAPDLDLIIGGDGPMALSLRQRADAAGLGNRVHFLGPIPSESRHAVISAFDIACFPGTAHRNANQGVSPLKICDYAACGRAIVSSDLPGLEALVDARAIKLYRPDDTAGLAAALVDLSRNAVLRQELGDHARALAKQRFGWAHITARIAEEGAGVPRGTEPVEASSPSS